ncbi:HATPase_Hsp90-like domain containing protein [Comamonadaceae bacterium]
MSIIQQIAAKRQLLLDGIEENEGDINLRIFEDFYPDEAHFIFELLQNAEDAGASEVSFELTAHGCSFEHNGTRHFNEQDIRSITGIFNSSKKNRVDKIGKFGVGFKSVFVYTDSPIIYSKPHSFKIVKLVLPQEVPPRPNLGERTRFEFPFNSPKKNVEEAYAEVKSGLEQLSENTLLFLRNLGYIKWKIGAQEGELLREEHTDNHVEVLKQLDGKEVLSSHWLRFSAPVKLDEAFSAAVDGVERQQVSIAFELTFTGDKKSFDKTKPIKEQLKITPALQGKVSVFFPAEKETSGLRFHLHGPFIPELSRASIKNSTENLALFGQLASLTSTSLHSIKKLGLLNGEFLAVLPNNDDPLPERYKVIRKAVLDEMKISPLVPCYRGGHAQATRLLQARATLKALLTTEDLTFVTERDDSPEWAIGATQRNSNQDRLISSLGIEVWDAGDLKAFFEHRARVSDAYWDEAKLSQEVLDWLQEKSDEWLQALYAVMLKHCEEESDFGELDQVYFVRLASGEWSTAAGSFFQTDASGALEQTNCVDEKIFSAGTKKLQQQDARKFLAELGVRVPNEADAMVQLLEGSYQDGCIPPSDVEYRQHLDVMISFLERNPSHKGMFAKAKVFKVASLNASWVSAGRVYLDEPYGRSGLAMLYGLVSDQKGKRWPLDDWYRQCGIPLEKVVKFAEFLGCQREFDKLHVAARCSDNPNWNHLRLAPGSRAGNVISRDFALSAEALLLLQTQDTNAIQLIWRALCRSETSWPTILQACFQYNDRGGPRHSDSQLVVALRDMAWVPQTDGTFVKPKDAVSTRLPKGFSYDAGHKWLQALEFGSVNARRGVETAARSAKRSELGFKSEEELQRALEFTKFPPDEQARILAEAMAPKPETIELPERPVRNPDLRVQRVGEEAKNTPRKETAIRERSVPLGAAEAIADAKVYLQDQYTNSNGQMICQVCKDELPFRLPSGAYFFEAVELVADTKKRHRSIYLSLCPNHAAAYRHANGQRNSMGELVVIASANEIEVSLGGRETSIYFTQTHLADAKACISVDESESFI